ncbi:PAS domain-containing protein [Methanoregula sp.]|uniref:PAS domain-containing protein n=1 Tax=Methanoregula sp. TaxID=2052170 RepID=UPI002CE3287A|nr:PAS domain-containing protein [Methanoregula sp.]HVP95936.1 PAS domain-containing protein [Methanoregula sp.]
MTDTERLTWPVRRRGDFFRIVSYIVLATALIFVIDVITPLGVVIWVLYLIPLFLTMYLSWKYAPLLMTGVFILLMAASLLLSPRDLPLGYALIDRVFFALILIIASFFIRDYVASVEEIAASEERYRSLVEWLTVGIAVCREDRVLYLNPAGRRLMGLAEGDATEKADITGMIDPKDRDLFRERTSQAIHGARITMENVRLTRPDGSTVSLDLNLGTVSWDRSTALQIVMRSA